MSLWSTLESASYEVGRARPRSRFARDYKRNLFGDIIPHPRVGAHMASDQVTARIRPVNSISKF
jgi:hypothetical protein